MTFTPNIPQPTQSLGQTQAAILNNFANYNTVVSVDHVSPNALNQGNHKQVTFYNYGNPPAYSPSSGQSFLYASNASTSGSQLVYQPTVVAAQFTVPVTPRAVARILRTNVPLNYTLVGGPYGASSSFNAAAPTNPFSTSFVFNFASALASSDYFVVISYENASPPGPAFIATKTNSSFIVSFSNIAANNVYFTIMVY